MPAKKSAKKAEPGFREAVAEVESILERLEADEIDIDDLGGEVRRAVELIGLCRAKLDRTETEVREFVAGLQEDAAPASAATSDPAAGDDGGELPF